jgi:ketosteroid isomerase-like protein
MSESAAEERYAIERLKYRYMRYLDTKDWAGMAEVFTEDAVGEWSGGKIRKEGAASILEFFRESMDSPQFLSSHRVHQPEIDLHSDTEASAIWALEDTVVMREYGLLLQGAAFYEDDYRKVDGIWKISRTGYRRTFEYIVPTESLPGFRVTASFWDTGGQSLLV